jgi:hypothetical protein
MDATGQSATEAPLRVRRYDVFAWVLSMAVGFGALVTYQMRAAPPAVLPAEWPHGVDLAFDARRSNLIMFAHPRCPCSDASLEELKVILTRGGKELAATICFFQPPDVPPDWTDTRLIRAARAIPGLHVVLDRDGAITAKFGAVTSGQVVLFDPQGRRLFAGGITAARGHAGENQGRAWILALAKGEVCAPGPTPVYGCALQDAPVAGGDQ